MASAAALRAAATRALLSAPGGSVGGVARAHARTFGSGGAPTEVYRRVRRARAAGMSGLALAQGGFWAGGAWMAAAADGGVVSPAWMAGGTVLSAVFAGMVGAYLSRAVAVLAVGGGRGGAEEVRVTTYRFGGGLREAEVLATREIVGGPKGADDDERHWTFGVRERPGGPTRFYIVDRKNGVLDEEALRCICSADPGGEQLLVLAHKRRAGEMKARWRDWEESKDGARGSGGTP